MYNEEEFEQREGLIKLKKERTGFDRNRK